MSQFCPAWIYSSVCALTAQRYLSESLGLEAFAGKYAKVLGEHYSDVTEEMVLTTAEGYLRYLMEAEVEDASEILRAFAFHRISYDKNGAPRRIKRFFSSALDGLKSPEVNVKTLTREFKPFIYMFRTKPELAAPSGWTWKNVEDAEWLGDLPELDVSFMDGF